MTTFGNIIIWLIVALILANVFTVLTLVGTRADLKDFQQETVLQIEEIKYDVEMLEYRVHKLEHPAPEKEVVTDEID